MIKILHADDHAIVRQGLKQVLADTPGISVTGEASTAKETLELLKKGKWDLLILDIVLPDQTGVELLGQVRELYPDLPVLVMSIHDEVQYAVRVLRAGACGYLTKDSAPDQLITAIQKVAEGEKYVSPSIAQRFVFEMGTDADKPRHEVLSKREFQVMCLIGSGKSLREIAEELGLSAKTVSVHRDRILKKMKMKHNAELIRYTLQSQLV